MKSFASWWVSLSMSQAMAAMFAAFLIFLAIGIGWTWWRDPIRVEIRQIKRRKHHIYVANAELAKYREDINVRVSRGFLRAMRDRAQS
jgi:hypothetical protein